MLRTNLGRAAMLRRDIIRANAEGAPLASESWRDIPMHPIGNGWELQLPIAETGFFRAKAYLQDPRGWQHWPDGPDVGISVHPDYCRSGNLIYCAFARMFGASKSLLTNTDSAVEVQLKPYDSLGYTLIPPSGKLRDVMRALPHIFQDLGCRILHLLPVHPTPTTYARFGRFGSPYAALDLTAIDPALVEFDKRTTGVDQFCELTYSAHVLGGRVFLDIVINHTGWGSVLQENHPEWFLRNPDGTFASPGAWGNTWEDLVELKHQNVQLWDQLSVMFLTWCRRGVDGFRCDAGYKVPVDAWRYIIARVQEEFPDTVFLLEGLGGAWEATEELLTEGGMQWAYSELFQNYSADHVHTYLKHSLKQTERVGLLVHYSETHDNDRLARKGRAWALLRNRLCALTSVSGGFGLTCGGEWLATEKIRVHGSTGMNWGSADNLVPDIKRLSFLLAEHPCFQDGAKIEILSPESSPVLALRRSLPASQDEVLVLVNTDAERVQVLPLSTLKDLEHATREWSDLLEQTSPPTAGRGGAESIALAPGAAYCLAPQKHFHGLAGSEYRRLRALAAFGIQAITQLIPAEKVEPPGWRELASLVNLSAVDFLATVSALQKAWSSGRLNRVCAGDLHRAFAQQQSKSAFCNVLEWTLLDQRRTMPVPPDHWVLIRDVVPFRCAITVGDHPAIRKQSVRGGDGYFACLAPSDRKGLAVLQMERYEPSNPVATAHLLFLNNDPTLTLPAKPKPSDIVLLTNRRGGMARLCVDLGRVTSKYDCVLGANLHPDVPVDRHVFVKRLRVWVNADGFITPVDFPRLSRFTLAPLPSWEFVASAGDGRTVQIRVRAMMVQDQNTVAFQFSRPGAHDAEGKQLPANADVRLTVRPDIEDRNFHQETKRNGGADAHFSTHSRALPAPQIGFEFTPRADRRLTVTSSSGTYHAQPEWSHNIPHPVEQTRGQEGHGDSHSPGWFEIPLPKDSATVITLTAEAIPGAVTSAGFDAQPVSNTPTDGVTFEATLSRACSSFVARRGRHKTVIAGYPWFLDWGRDTLICARGLIAAGLIKEVKELLITFARFEDRGTLPNTIHGEDASNRDTTDAPLWFGIVLEELAERCGPGLYQTKVHADGRTFLTTLRSIANGYLAGTPNGIRVDPESKLVWSPAHFTWMDTNYPACTPRQGYPVEIQALWVRLLRHLAAVDLDADRWSGLAAAAMNSVESRFWLKEFGWFSDVLIADAGQGALTAIPDDALRSNCLFLPGLGLVNDSRARQCVTAAQRFLVVPGALRTLAPRPVIVPLPNRNSGGALLNDPLNPYWGTYEGDEDTRRKPAYHNGSAWTWTFPTFCEAMARAWSFSPESVQASKAYLLSMRGLLEEGCLGHLPELLDGDAPHRQRGCDAQAWSATEALRVWKVLNREKNSTL